MSDGDIDFSRYSVEQLVGILKRIDRERFPRNYQNARDALRTLWPEAPDDLSLVGAGNLPVPREPMQVLSDGTRRFAVHFTPPRTGGRGAPSTNDQRLTGSGWVDVSASQVLFTELRNGAAVREVGFALADVANVEWSDIEGVVVVRTARDERYVTLWLQLPEEAAALKQLLPATVTAEFSAQREHEADFSNRLREVSPRAPVVPVLIALNVIVFIIMAASGAGLVEANGEVHIRFGSNYGGLTWAGEPWRLLTSAFLHFGVFHIAMNMYALYNGGVLTERLYGSARFLVIYLLAALAGSVASGWWDPSRNSAGASGAVFGVYGALLAFFAVRRQDIPASLLKSAGKGALLLCGYSLVIGATSPFIDNACHVGGLLGGALAGLLLARPFQVEARAQRQPARIAGVAAGICAALALVSMPLWSVGGSRHAQVVASNEIQKFIDTENVLVNRYTEIANAVDKQQLPPREAAKRMDAEVIRPWREATQSLLNVDASALKDADEARHFEKLQQYVRYRDEAMTLTARLLATGQTRTTTEVDQAWNRVQAMIKSLSEDR